MNPFDQNPFNQVSSATVPTIDWTALTTSNVFGNLTMSQSTPAVIKEQQTNALNILSTPTKIDIPKPSTIPNLNPIPAALGFLGKVADALDVVSGSISAPYNLFMSPEQTGVPRRFSEQAAAAVSSSGLPSQVTQPIGFLAGILGDPLNLVGGAEIKGAELLSKIPKGLESILGEAKTFESADKFLNATSKTSQGVLPSTNLETFTKALAEADPRQAELKTLKTAMDAAYKDTSEKLAKLPEQGIGTAERDTLTKQFYEGPAKQFSDLSATIASDAQKAAKTQLTTIFDALKSGKISDAAIQAMKEGTQLPPGTQSLSRSSLQDLSSSFDPRMTSAGSQATDIAATIDKLTKALKEAVPIRAEQEKLYTAARAQKLAKVMAIRAKSGGEKGFYSELGALKGELPKAQFDTIRKQFGQGEVDNLFNAVTQSNRIGTWEKISAREGLAKIFGEFGGTVPTESELRLLGRVFPPEMIKALQKMQPFWTKVKQGTGEVLNIPRSLASSFDLSAPFRQGLYVIGHPKIFAKAFGNMFKAFASEKGYKALMDSIEARPTYPLMRDSKLALTDVSAGLSDREERFLSNFAEKIPIIGRGVRASGRAYTGFLNLVRADNFDHMLLRAKDMTDVNIDVTKDIARFVNAATGRGPLGPLEAAGPVLNGVLFSPRLAASRVALLNPAFYIGLHPAVRKEAIKTMLSSGSIILTMLGLSAAAGAKVELNPTNADFLKVRVGDTRLDVMGGLQQYIRLSAQLLTGKITSSTTGKVLTLGEGYKPLTRKDIIYRFFEGKENPIASFITSMLNGQDVVGNEFNLTRETVNRFIPLFIQDMRDTIKEWGPIEGTALSVPGLFGVGLQTYGEKTPLYKNKKAPEPAASGTNPFN